MILNVSPRFSSDDKVNGWSANAKHVGQLVGVVFSVQFSDFLYLSWIKFSQTVARSARMFTSFFGKHVTHILLMRPEKQMIRVGAFRIVASVQNMFPFWNLSIVDFPRNAMGADHFTFNGKTPVSARVVTADPFPASLCFNNLWPKSWFNRHGIAHKEVLYGSS